MPTVSIIVPCYNAENYIERCLISILNQTFRDFELILVNDCSTDSTITTVCRIIKDYNTAVKVIENPYNMGPSLTRRRGIDSSSSEYVAFCDSDDWIQNDFLECLVKASDDGKNDIVFCNYQSIYSNGRVKKHDVVSSIMKEGKKRLIGKSFDSLCCMMIRKRIIESIAFPNIRNGEDMAIIPPIIVASDTFGFVDKCIYNYFYHLGSLSKTYTNEMINSLRTSFQYICDSIGETYPEETEFLGIRNYLYGGLLNLFKDKKDNKESAIEILECFEKIYPEWRKNYLFSTLPLYKRVYLSAAKKRLFFCCRIMSTIHMALSK